MQVPISQTTQCPHTLSFLGDEQLSPFLVDFTWQDEETNAFEKFKWRFMRSQDVDNPWMSRGDERAARVI